MGIAFGLVGLSDDIVQWNTARRWLLPTRITIRPGNLLLAVISTLFSRMLGLLPVIMFGIPEAFEIDPESHDQNHENRLLGLAAGILLAILAVSWLPTILTSLLLTAGYTLSAGWQPFVVIPLSALQSLLLLIFAVTVQNLFLHMLALPETIGEMIKGWNRIVWILVLLGATFVYLQFLLNPTGDLAHSLQTSNVRAFLVTVGVFTLFTMLATLLIRRFDPPPMVEQPEAPIAVIEAFPSEDQVPPEPPQAETSASS
jgi:hypothetical protein